MAFHNLVIVGVDGQRIIPFAGYAYPGSEGNDFSDCRYQDYYNNPANDFLMLSDACDRCRGVALVNGRYEQTVTRWDGECCIFVTSSIADHWIVDACPSCGYETPDVYGTLEWAHSGNEGDCELCAEKPAGDVYENWRCRQCHRLILRRDADWGQACRPCAETDGLSLERRII